QQHNPRPSPPQGVPPQASQQPCAATQRVPEEGKEQRKHSNPHSNKYGDKLWAGCSRDGCLKHHHGSEHFAPLHLVERLFNLIEGNSLRYEPFEVEPAL